MPQRSTFAETAPAFIDDAGQTHEAARGAVRIVSLVPSLTELLFDFDLGGVVVGRTDFCRHPAARIGAVPSVGGTKTVDRATLAALVPTHVIVNVDETPRALYDQLIADGYRVIVTHPCAVEDNLRLYRLIGGLFDRGPAADARVGGLEAALAEAVAARTALPQRSVLYLIWRKPWMTVDRTTYISQMLAHVNWLTVPARSVDRYPSIEMDETLLSQVDLVLFASEPFPFSEKRVAQFRADFPAHAGKAVSIDGEMISWYGSRAIAGLRYALQLARKLRDRP